SGGATRQFRIDGEEKNKEFLGHFLFSIPYHLNNVNDVLIIGPGGGLEILIGKYFKVRHIDAVDINSDIINILTGRNKNDRLRDIYSRLALSNKETTTVKYYVDDGRSFLSRKNAGFSKYDIVQLTNVDLLSTLTSGGMVLSESYLYTQEALRYYYDSLKENGYIQICYWAGPFGLRLFLTALEMLRTIKVERPENSLVVVGDMKWNINLLIKKGMFSDRELAEIRKICAADNFKVFFTPDMPAYFGDYFISESVNWFQVDSRHYCLASRSDTRKSLIRSFPYNINPTYDDKPFFYSIRTSKGYSFFTGVLVTLFQNKINLVLSLTGIALAFLIILLPLILKEIKAGYIGMVPFRHLLFFGITGLAFSLIEVIMIQKVAIFAGGPFYSMCLTLPTILIFYSLGAFSTVKIKIPRVWFLVISVGGIVLYGLLGYLFFDNVIRSLFYLRHLERIIFTVIIISPLGFFLGIPLSVVLEAVKGIVEKIITPWMWGVNSCGNVVGALFFVPIAHITGFNLLLMVSCFLYLVALCLLLPDTQTKFSK
ncbi:MAG: hypothetical protein NC923_06880, partial [Candidatus Omnitrophica bacterium]|nr:hypothetical protein [Candidatus Omnitrophota bacterium]